jgi:hypothetical protein
MILADFERSLENTAEFKFPARILINNGPCHVSGIPLQKGISPFAKEINRAIWLDREGKKNPAHMTRANNKVENSRITTFIESSDGGTIFCYFTKPFYAELDIFLHEVSKKGTHIFVLNWRI